MRRAVILFPSGLTLGNLFFGIFAIVAASRLEFRVAGVYVMLGGICDALDGRVARATNAGTQFGEELDSLVDAITFGLAPAIIMYFAVLNRDGWDWTWVFVFAACAVMRLARFNIEQAGTTKTYFQGLPSPAAGITLASYYWFSQSWLYNYGAVADLKWHVLLRYLMVALAALMISNVPYPSFPRTGFRSVRSIAATLLVFGSMALLASGKLEYFFPCALIYVAWGLFRWVFAGLLERRQPTVPYDLSEGEDDEDEEEDDEEYEPTDSRVHAARQGHREERPVRVETARDRSARPVRGERAAAAPVPADRQRKKERSKRPGRAQRPEEATEPNLVPTGLEPVAFVSPSSDTGMPATAATIAAIPVPDDDEEGVMPGERSDRDETISAADAIDGAPPRKRKRRRRRGERKDRPSVAGSEQGSSDQGSVDPYAAEPAVPAPASEPQSLPFAPPAPPAPPSSSQPPE
jgi:CDP-diacylglycerol--serine O-phosphatidyltransferase